MYGGGDISNFRNYELYIESGVYCIWYPAPWFFMKIEAIPKYSDI